MEGVCVRPPGEYFTTWDVEGSLVVLWDTWSAHVDSMTEKRFGPTWLLLTNPSSQTRLIERRLFLLAIFFLRGTPSAVLSRPQSSAIGFAEVKEEPGEGRHE
jgi:hypothetical protein